MERFEYKQKYLKIYEDFRGDIVRGEYKTGEKLPSKRDVASRYGVSVITVEHAYELLASEGYVSAAERKGYFCSFDSKDSYLTAVPVKKAPGSVSLPAAGDLFPFGLYAKAVRGVLSDIGEGVYVKSPPQGLYRLREEISEYLIKSRRMNVTPERVVFGAGAESLYGVIVEIAGSGKVFAVEDPSYEQIEKIYISKGVKCELLKLGSHGIRTSELKKSRADVLHVTPYRSFPSGVSADVSKRHEYLLWASEGDRLIVEDDFGSEFTESGNIYNTLFSKDREGKVIYLNTFSQTLFPGMRVAYMVLPERLFEMHSDMLSRYSCAVPTLDQYVLSRLFESGEYERHINRMRRKIRAAARGEKT